MAMIKRTFYAADMVDGGARTEYAHKTPSQLLADIIDIGGGNLDFGASEMREFGRIMPEKMVGVSYGSRGEAVIKSYSRNDFLGAGTNGSTISGSGIVDILVGDTIMEGAMAYTCARQVVKTIRMRTETETVPFFTSRKYASQKAPGAEMEDLAQDLGKSLLQAKVYSFTSGLDKGLLQDASGDLKASVLKEMGGGMEMTIDRLVLSALLDNAGQTADAATADDALKAFAFARGKIGKEGFIANAAIVSPMAMAYMMNKLYIPAYNEVAQNMALSSAPDGGLVTSWLGLKIGQSGVQPNGTKTAYDWGSANDYGGVVFDNTKIGVLGIREDMNFSEFDNITKYLLNPCLVSRFDFAVSKDAVKTGRNNLKSACLIKETA